jgi:ribosome-associated protein
VFLSRQSQDLKVQQKPGRAKSAGAVKEAAASRKGQTAGTSESSKMLALVLESLEEDKAEDVVSIDLTGKTPIADHMVVASGRSQRHVGAVADHLVRRMKEAGFGTSQVEGMKQGDWVLIDGGDVVIHVFRPEVREFYRLEKMWSADIPADQLAV